uniref:DUF4371 domain-containing protein n=1 Tax=Gasterosteus aculeatus aculeatus TaxID=481459 RepID=A0AAQ4R3J4_GASAC
MMQRAQGEEKHQVEYRGDRLMREQNHDSGEPKSGEEERGGNERRPTENEETEKGETEKDEIEGGDEETGVSETEDTVRGEIESRCHPHIWTEKQHTQFKKANPWLIVNGEFLGCKICKKVKGLGVFKETGMCLSNEWPAIKVTYSHNGDHKYQLSCLRSQIYKHATSEPQGSRRHSEHKTHNTYFMAKKNRPFTDYHELVVLQQENGLDMGITLHSRYTAKNIIDHTTDEMRKKILNHIVTEDQRFSVLIDESTTLSNKTALVVYLRSIISEVPTVIFLDLVEMESQSAENITKSLLQCLQTWGMDEDFIKENFIAFASDGASAMLDRKSGVAARLQLLYPHLIVWHCLNHRLESAVGDTVKHTNNVNHFKSFLDKLYTLYHRSPKNCLELAEHAQQLEVNLQNIERVLDVRWAASSFRTVKVAMYRGLMTKMEQEEFLCDLALMYDTLEEISHLSLNLQVRGMTLTRADTLMRRTIRIVPSMINCPGDRRQEALQAAEKHDVSAENKAQYSELLDHFKILHPANWPVPLQEPYGESNVKQLPQRFRLDDRKILEGFRDFKDNSSSSSSFQKTLHHYITLHAPLMNIHHLIPVSTAECEREFSLTSSPPTFLPVAPRSSFILSTFTSGNGNRLTKQRAGAPGYLQNQWDYIFF